MNFDEACKAAQLTSLQRYYVQLCIIDGHPIRTVARAHNTSPATVRGHIDAGLQKLRPHMKSKRHGNDPESQQRVEEYEKRRSDMQYRSASARRARIANSKTAPIKRSEIIERDNRTCHICGKTNLANNEIHLDHVIPISRGGDHTPENIKVACAPCNIAKGARVA